jgi:hypothetical protein
MTARGVIVGAQHPAMQELHAIIEELDPEAAAGLTRYTPGNALPNSFKQPEAYSLYMLESLLILARVVRGRKRGRRRNIEFHDKGDAA